MSDSGQQGYSGKPLWQKLGLKPGLRIRVVDCPLDYAEMVGRDAASLTLVGARARFDLVHVFATEGNMLGNWLRSVSSRLQADGVVWVSWPKKSSRMPSDVTEDTIRRLALPLGLVDIKVCAIDATWSGLKLVWRKEHREKMKQDSAH